MSFIDLEQLSAQEIVLHYLVEVRGGGFFFPYQDLAYIDQWIKVCADLDELLVILSEVAPKYFDKKSTWGASKTKSLVGLHKMVIRRVQDRKNLGMSTKSDFGDM